MSFPVAEAAVVSRPNTAVGMEVNVSMGYTLEKWVFSFLGPR